MSDQKASSQEHVFSFACPICLYRLFFNILSHLFLVSPDDPWSWVRHGCWPSSEGTHRTPDGRWSEAMLDSELHPGDWRESCYSQVKRMIVLSYLEYCNYNVPVTCNPQISKWSCALAFDGCKFGPPTHGCSYHLLQFPMGVGSFGQSYATERTSVSW